MLLLIHCLLFLPLFVGGLCLVLVFFFIQYFVLLVLQSPVWEMRVGCFTLIVFLRSCGCLCSVALPHGTICWSAVCDCGISYSYLLAF